MRENGNGGLKEKFGVKVENVGVEGKWEGNGGV